MADDGVYGLLPFHQFAWLAVVHNKVNILFKSVGVF